MTLQDPVAIYNAASNVEAYFLCDQLTEAGIEAFAVEDVSQVGAWIGGLLPEVHKPRVWVGRADVEWAAQVINDYERRLSERRNAEEKRNPTESCIAAACEECGETADYPAVLRGTVQQCPQCGAYVDIETPPLSGPVRAEDEEETGEA